MANLGKIKLLLAEKNITLRDLAGSVGMTEQGLHKLIKENSTKVDTLEKIANRLDVSVSVFFDETEAHSRDSTEFVTVSKDAWDMMKLQAETISSQQRTIENLSNLNDRRDIADTA
jgi:DNA-binding Xre family transcriptional regulator